MNRGIPTIYRGIEYRSRLEARWAAFFDGIGWKHTYEPFDASGYIPDFLIHGARPLLVEIKPAVMKDDYWAPVGKIEATLPNHWQCDVLILGADPLPSVFNRDRGHWVSEINRRISSQMNSDWPSLGLIGKRPSNHPHRDPTRTWHWLSGCWQSCDFCHATIAVGDAWEERNPCGCANGCGGINLNEADVSLIQNSWAAACNAVKWHGRNAS
jgi:hypothetical protein